MKTSGIRSVSIFLCIMMFLTGCGGRTEKYIEFSDDISRDYYAPWEEKFVTFEWTGRRAEFFICNFETGEKKPIKTIPQFAASGLEQILLDGKLYFYITEGDESGNLVNVLYRVDYEKEIMEEISRNTCEFMLTPIAQINGRIYSLQGSEPSFVEQLNLDGSAEPAALDKGGQAKDEVRKILHMAADGEKLYILEREETEGGYEIYVSVYDESLSLIKEARVTEAVNQCEFNGGAVNFWACGDYFAIGDMSDSLTMFRLRNKEAEILWTEEPLRVFSNTSYSKDKLFFRWNTNEIYRLNLDTGELEPLSYKVNREGEKWNIGLAFISNEQIYLAKIPDTDKFGEEEELTQRMYRMKLSEISD